MCHALISEARVEVLETLDPISIQPRSRDGEVPQKPTSPSVHQSSYTEDLPVQSSTHILEIKSPQYRSSLQFLAEGICNNFTEILDLFCPYCDSVGTGSTSNPVLSTVSGEIPLLAGLKIQIFMIRIHQLWDGMYWNFSWLEGLAFQVQY